MFAASNSTICSVPAFVPCEITFLLYINNICYLYKEWINPQKKAHLLLEIIPVEVV